MSHEQTQVEKLRQLARQAGAQNPWQVGRALHYWANNGRWPADITPGLQKTCERLQDRAFEIVSAG